MATSSVVHGPVRDELDARLTELRSRFGPARSFEHPNPAVTLLALTAIVRAALERIGVTSLIALVGKAVPPAVIRLHVDDLPHLVEEVGRSRGTLTLATEPGDGILLLCLPGTMGEGEEMLASGTGTLCAAIDTLVAALPGGTEFRGN